MSEYTIDHTETCCVCGSPIWSEASIRRGYGSECANAIKAAKCERVFSNPELKRKYYEISAKLLINAISEKNFRSEFKKSFQESVIKQGNWLSKKQADICRSILFDYDQDAKDKFEVEESHLKEEFWEKIPITHEDIEIARRKIREKREEN